MNYPDLDFILSILLKGDHTVQAANLLRNLAHPLTLSLVHRLQIENALLRSRYGSDVEAAAIAVAGLGMWRQYLEEQVFVIEPFDLEISFAKAAAWNAASRKQPVRWSLLIHAAIAASSGATFLSFDPTLRKVAADEGLDVLPGG